ncbi:MAG: hypothetical protein GYA23_08355, partial [Methanomicrobiales archaeon]|nr:hypothetical protein [Methanomicrobiales archaeon]
MFLQEGDTISTRRDRGQDPGRVSGRVDRKEHHTAKNLLISLAFLLAAVPLVTAAGMDASGPQNVTTPQGVTITVFVVDFQRFEVAAGSVGADFYLNVKSDSPVSLDDLELMNGMFTSVSKVVDTPNEKEYRVIAVLTAEPDLKRYPFDRHTLHLKLEPRVKNEQKMVLVIDPAMTGLNQEADIPGWEFTGARYYVTNYTYAKNEGAFSRAVFEYGIQRDVTSTILKFFLPLFLIVLVSLASLMMKVTSRLGLNASMFLAAVLIHWRLADAIPGVAYATFLDMFMIVT